MPPFEGRFYATASGCDVIADFLDQLPTKAAAKCLVMMERLATGAIHLHPKKKNRTHLRTGIWEFRVFHAGEQYRFLYFVEGSVAHVLVAVHKKTQKMDEQDIRLAEQRRSDILSDRR